LLLQKGTQEWTDQKAYVRELASAVESSRQQMDLSELTVKQLTDLKRDMVKVMRDSVIGSEEYIAAAKKIEEISPILEKVHKDMRGVGEETDNQTDIWSKYVVGLAKMEVELIEATAKMKALEKGTEEWTKAKEDVERLGESIGTARNQMDLSKMTVTELRELQSGLVEVINKSVVGSEEYNLAAKKLSEVNPVLEAVDKDLKSIGSEGEKQLGMWGQFKEDFTRAFSVVSVFEAGEAIVSFGKEVFDVTSKFEKYEAVLSNALGSQEAATKKMDELQNLAASTPFSIDELTESYVKYVNRGIRPSMDEMTKMGDIAASQGSLSTS
jgi:TATA-box binding protein (TBP) (component of TFIID and TFIIIB)